MSKIFIFDIGKTNKKALVFESDGRLIEEEKARIEEITVESQQLEDLEAMEAFFLKALEKAFKSYPDIRSIGIVAHGASYVALGKDGHALRRPHSYLDQSSEKLETEWQAILHKNSDSLKTCYTPNLPVFLNMGKNLWTYLRLYPEDKNRLQAFLTLPGYFHFLLSGSIRYDHTYLGCHSFLWDFSNKNWSTLSEKLGLSDFLPETPRSSFDYSDALLDKWKTQWSVDQAVIVHGGLHDSNASLLPYRPKYGKNFTLLSTGSWCVGMKSEESIHENLASIHPQLFYNQGVGNEVYRTGIFTGGIEHDRLAQEPAIEAILEAGDEKKQLKAAETIIDKADCFLMSNLLPALGLFGNSPARLLEGNDITAVLDASGEYSEAFKQKVATQSETVYAALNIGLGIKAAYLLDHLEKDISTRDIISIEGGFKNNPVFVAVLHTLYKERLIFSDIPQATALGNVQVLQAIQNKSTLEDVHLSINYESSKDLNSLIFDEVKLKHYISKWQGHFL